MKKTRLFVYGGLLDSKKTYDYRVRGEMRYRTRGDPGARFGKEYDTWVYGQVKEYSQAEIRRLIYFEAPQYELQKIGHDLYSFVDVEPRFEKEEIIPNGRWINK